MPHAAVNQSMPAPAQDTRDSTARQRVKELADHCHAYRGADTRRSIVQLTTTVALFVLALGTVMFSFYHKIYWLYALALFPAAGLIIRLFIIQHDCGHGSFFKSRRACDITGRFISLITFTPYDLWKKAHNIHHATSGNLSKRGAGSVDTLTVAEYTALPPRARFFYRVYRNPFFLLVLGPPVYIFILQRFFPQQSLPYLKDFHPVPTSESRRSVMSLNVLLLGVYGLMAAILDWQAVFLVYVPVLAVAFWFGQWLFFMQHQFEDTYWERGENWSFPNAALQGSSYYVLPRVLQWFSGSIGFHHIHHLCHAIPNYRLQECCDDHPELSGMNRITLLQSLKCATLALWDEKQRKLIGFRDLEKVNA